MSIKTFPLRDYDTAARDSQRAFNARANRRQLCAPATSTIDAYTLRCEAPSNGRLLAFAALTALGVWALAGALFA